MIKQYYSWKLRKRKKSSQYNTDLLRLMKDVHSILIVCVEKNTAIMSFSSNLQNLYPSGKIDTWVYSELSEKQRKGKSGVSKEVRDDILKMKFDMIIDITPFVSEEWFYFFSFMAGDIKVGVSKSDDYQLYDLVISFGTGRTVVDGYRMVSEYIKKLADI